MILRVTHLLLRWLFAPLVAEVGLRGTSVITLLLPQPGEWGPNMAQMPAVRGGMAP
jgi:hypothetical protein